MSVGQDYLCFNNELRSLDNIADYKKEIASTYPLNPNGSPDGITGLTSTDGRVTILMPHPERAMEDLLGGDDGIRMLKGFLQ